MNTSKNSTAERAAEYTALAPAQKTIIRILAVNVDYCPSKRMLDCLEELGVTSPKTDVPYNVRTIQPLQKELIEKGLVLKSNNGLCCLESIQKVVVRDSLAENQFSGIAQAVRKSILLGAAPHNVVLNNYKQYARSMQMALFSGNSIEEVYSIFNKVNQYSIDTYTDTLEQYAQFGGELRFRASVAAIINKDDTVQGIRLENGEEITADAVLSTVGIPGTAQLSGWPLDIDEYIGRMTFMETISMLPELHLPPERAGRTILFYSLNDELRYHRPAEPIDPSWGVICFPDNFQGLERQNDAPTQVRVTNAANYDLWQQAAADREQYRHLKEACGRQSVAAVSKILGNYTQGAIFQDSFTPMTIERFTEKRGGAVYGSPIKIKSGRTPWSNLFIAGTDQGYLGIVGAMLSGVTIVNQHLLT